MQAITNSSEKTTLSNLNETGYNSKELHHKDSSSLFIVPVPVTAVKCSAMDTHLHVNRYAVREEFTIHECLECIL